MIIRERKVMMTNGNETTITPRCIIIWANEKMVMIFTEIK